MTTPDRFKGIELKIERAKAHVRELNEAIQRFHDTKPYEAVGSEDDPEPGDCTYYLRLHREPPPSLGSIFGDAIHNLRSALDHLAVQLVEVNNGTVTEGTAFPVLKKPPGSPQVLEAAVKAKVGGARQEALDLIMVCEPYEGGNGHALWMLHRLDILDKHYAVIPALSSYQKFGLNVDIDIPWSDAPVSFPRVDIPVKKQCPVKDGHPLLRFAAASRGEIDKKPEFAISIAINEPGIVECQPVGELLAQVGEFVERTIEPFRPLLT